MKNCFFVNTFSFSFSNSFLVTMVNLEVDQSIYKLRAHIRQKSSSPLFHFSHSTILSLRVIYSWETIKAHLQISISTKVNKYFAIKLKISNKLRVKESDLRHVTSHSRTVTEQERKKWSPRTLRKRRF